jgi:NDP-sugar pyrophosphorylase family protein
LKGLILAGGFATRLRPLSCSKPKLLFPLVGVPLVDRMAAWFARGGVTEVILAVNHLSDKLRIEVSRRKLDTKTALSVEESALGTGGPISLARPLLNSDEPLIVANGDVISDIDLQGLVTAHAQSGAQATIALVSARDPRPFGLATLDANDQITGFEEKSETNRGPGWINAGVYALDPRVVAMIPHGRPVSLEREIFPILANQRKMRGWKHRGFWYDIGKIPDYIIANRQLLQRADFRETTDGENSMHRAKIGQPSYVGKDCTVDDSAKVGPYTILSERVSVKRGAEVSETIAFEQTSLGENCTIQDSLIGEGVTVGKEARIGKGSIIAGQVVIPDRAVIRPGSIVLN